MDRPIPFDQAITPAYVQENIIDQYPMKGAGADAIANNLQSVQFDPDPVLPLDRMYFSDEIADVDTMRALSFLSRDEVHARFPGETMAWLGVSDLYGSEGFLKGAESIHGYSADMLRAAKIFADHDVDDIATGAEILGNYDVMQAPHTTALDRIDLEAHIARSLKPDRELGPMQANKFSLHPLRTMAHPEGSPGAWDHKWGFGSIPTDDPTRRIDYEMFLDTPSGVALLHDGAPKAIATFARDNYERIGTDIKIHQLQGARGKIYDTTGPEDEKVGMTQSWELEPLDWKGLLVDVCEDIGRSVGAEHIAILPADQNPWTKPASKGMPPRLPLEFAVKTYDETAERLGFGRREHDNTWVRTIQ